MGGEAGEGGRREGRLGVKARVISERGAVFKFPDDGRRRYFSALGRLGGWGGEPPFSVLDSRLRNSESKGIVWFHVRGGGLTGSHRRRRSRLHLGWGFVRRPSQRGPTGRGSSSDAFQARALEGLRSDLQQVISSPPPPRTENSRIAFETARNRGHMLRNRNPLWSGAMHPVGAGGGEALSLWLAVELGAPVLGAENRVILT